MDAYVPVRTPNDRDDLMIQIDNLTADRDRVQRDLDAALLKIANVEGVIWDHISTYGKLDNDDVKCIVECLGMKLTKEVDVSYTVTFTGTAEIPLDVDVDDIDWDDEVEFTWNVVGEHVADLSEDSVDVDARDMF
jgi:hypothetical protein